MKKVKIVCTFTLFFLFFIILKGISEEVERRVLTFEKAFELTLSESPSLKASLAVIEEREGDRIQSKAYPNPLFSYSVENVFGNRNWRGWRAAESRYELSQPLEISGEREHRSRATFFHRLAAEAEYGRLQLETFNKLKKAFLSVVAAQELLELAILQKENAQEALNAALIKLEVGKVSSLEKNKAALHLSNSELELKKCRMDLERAKSQLSLFWGSSCPNFDTVEFPFFYIDCPRSFQELFESNQLNPALLEIYFSEWAAFEELEEQKSARIPDIIVTVGYKTLQDTKDKGLILGAAFPLPFFDRNRGNIHRARATTSRRDSLYEEKYALFENKLFILCQEADRSYKDALYLKTDLVDIALESLDFAKQGYREGKLDYSELLDAQKTFFEVKEKYIQTVLLFWEKEIDIEFLTL